MGEQYLYKDGANLSRVGSTVLDYLMRGPQGVAETALIALEL